MRPIKTPIEKAGTLITTNNSKEKETSLLPKILSASVLVSLTASLTACQSSPANLNSSKHLSTDATTQQIQLFDFSTNPSVSEHSKARFIKALNTHLSTEHISVSMGKNRIRPFVDAESIDADSQSVLQTVLETFAYTMAEERKQEEEYKTETIKEIIEELKEDETFADATEEEIKEEAEYRYQSDYKEEYKENNKKNASKKMLANYLKMKAEEIEAMKQQTDNKTNNNTGKQEEFLQDISSGKLSGVMRGVRKFDKLDDKEKMAFLLKFFQRTPEQIDAMQLYLMEPTSYQTFGHYIPKARQYKGVISYDYHSPTTQLSAQLPYGIDFTNKSATLDPAVVMPFVALFKPELLTALDDSNSLNKPRPISFSLPEEIADVVPADVLFDALIKGIGRGFADMDEEQFTPMVLTDDQYGKQLQAKRAVKVHWGAKQSGAFVGRVLKSMSRDLQAHIDKNPELYVKANSKSKNKKDIKVSPRQLKKLKQMLNLWASIEKDFQAKDVGGLYQLIEAIAPISFNQTMYYYLSTDDQLLGYQTKLSIGSELYGWTMDSVKQTRYQPKAVTSSPLYALYEKSLGKDAPASIDAIALMKKVAKEDSLQRQARYARYDYPEWDEVEENEAESEAETE
ncbi:MAG: hypothetical protein CR966_00285 [Pseudomonadales bacterium]|nr:MAG: hypothetical protein CR966_00285 [Pseudomonadales bacterium]